MRAKLNGTTLGAMALAAAGIVFGAAVTSATIGSAGAPADAAEPAPTQTPEGPAAEAQQPAGGGAIANEVIRLAAERAPFEPDRRPPDGRYLLPDERRVEEPRREEPEREPPPMPPFRVLGTIGGPDGGVVVIEAEGDEPKVYATGDRLLGYQVKSVQGDAVVVSSEGWDMTLAVESAASSFGRDDDDDRRRGRDEEREQERMERAMEQARERVNQIMQQMREQGGPVRIEMQGDRAVIVGPNGARREVELPGDGDRNVIIRPAAPAVRVRPGGPGGGGG